MFKVYLAGPITGLTYDGGQTWRTHAQFFLDAYGIQGYSPLRQKGFLRSAGVLGAATQYENPMASDMGIMTRDHYDCQSSDAILVNFVGATKISRGTDMEIGWAFAYRKPLVVAAEDGNPLLDHPMIRAAINYRLPTLEAALAVVVAILLPGVE